MIKYAIQHREACYVNLSDCIEYSKFWAHIEMTEFRKFSWYRWSLFWDMKDTQTFYNLNKQRMSCDLCQMNKGDLSGI